jgi:hypothetical protein
MPVPWVQIVRLMPSILEVSRELLKRARRAPAGEPPSGGSIAASPPLEARVAALEENERRQAELVTTAVTALHAQTRRLIAGQVATVVVAVVAIVLAVR